MDMRAVITLPNLPVVGNVPKGWVWAVGLGSVAVGGYVYLRRRNAAAATAGPGTTDTSGDTADAGAGYPDPNAIDPATGMTYAEEQALSGGGYYGTGGAGGVTDGSGLPGPGAFSTNAEWAQYAEQQLSGTVAATSLSAALGKYLTGGAVTGDQASLIDQAIAVAGYPPVGGPGGYPPAIKDQPDGGGGTGGGARYITATGTQDLNRTAAANHISENKLISLNPGLKHLEGTGRPIPKGTRVRVA
jgi:hypothetical protein